MKWSLKGGISIDAGPPRYVLWCCCGICQDFFTFLSDWLWPYTIQCFKNLFKHFLIQAIFFMNTFNVFFKWVFCANLALQRLHLKGFLGFMNCFHVFVQTAFFWKTFITKVALHFPFLMNRCHMFVQVKLSCKASLTNTAYERFLSFMNWCNV